MRAQPLTNQKEGNPIWKEVHHARSARTKSGTLRAGTCSFLFLNSSSPSSPSFLFFTNVQPQERVFLSPYARGQGTAVQLLSIDFDFVSFHFLSPSHFRTKGAASELRGAPQINRAAPTRRGTGPENAGRRRRPRWWFNQSGWPHDGESLHVPARGLFPFPCFVSLPCLVASPFH